MYCSPPGSFDHGDSPGKNTGVGCQALLQGTFPTWGSSPGFLKCRWSLYCLSRQGSPDIYMHPLFGGFTSHSGPHGALSTAPCAAWQVLVHCLLYTHHLSAEYMCQPQSPHSSHPLSPALESMPFFLCVCVCVSISAL